MTPPRIPNRISPTHSMCHMLCFSFVGAALSLPATSRAQASDAAAARALFQKARKAADTGDYTAACPKFAESYKLDPAVGTLLNIADCEQHLGRIATAWVTFQKALDQLSKGDDRRAIVEKAASSLEKRLPHLSIQLTSTVPKDSTVQRDGVQVGTSSLGMALPVIRGTTSSSSKLLGVRSDATISTLSRPSPRNFNASQAMQKQRAQQHRVLSRSSRQKHRKLEMPGVRLPLLWLQVRRPHRRHPINLPAPMHSQCTEACISEYLAVRVMCRIL